MNGTTPPPQGDYEALETMAAAGELRRVGPVRHRDGSRVSEADLDAVFTGRPSLGHDRAMGSGRSPRRQVRLSAATDAALESYVAAHGTTASAVIRDAIETYLAAAST
ncbi:gamma-glutamyltransferase [Peptidiphaga sp.]|jgi:hypothetical protein avisC_01783|uniref:gamma-glutamyltransferase n=1 Tax=Peptidiphaga sp. TaxID=2848648 RepID=UPI003605CEF5